ncbi:PilZ domain-containing protein [Pseudomonas sp. LRF_L74]|uniref:PilZ domain-containing protein n=1 Tax=Pseudomonas sp. LRF_L74 TaxID=3369422 RepID=UPI003F5DDF39
MTLDASRLDVPDLLEENSVPLADLGWLLSEARAQSTEQGQQQMAALLFRLNRSAMTLLERQRVLQSFSEEYRHYAMAYQGHEKPSRVFLRLCGELAIGFKHLLLQIMQSRHPSRPHLAWCLYMAEHFVVQALLRHYQLYQEPPANLWQDSHTLYHIAEQQQCLDEPIAAAFIPAAANTLRGIYQQGLLLALSDPFHLEEGECLLLFSALTPLAALARLTTWDEEEESEGPLVDLNKAQAYLLPEPITEPASDQLRRLELGPLLVALSDPAPLQSQAEHELLDRIQVHWSGRQRRRHSRADFNVTCNLAVGLPSIHAQLLEKRPPISSVQMLDASPGGARLLCPDDQSGQLPVGQLVLVLTHRGTPSLALVRWRHLNADGLHLGLRYLKGLPRPAWLRRTPSAHTHPAVLQSTPAPGSNWHHGLWLPTGQFVEGENLWLQLANVNNQAELPLPASNLETPSVARYPLRLA